MRKYLKFFLVFLLIIFGLFKLTEWYLESKFDDLVNKNPDRNYNISYEGFDLHTFFTGITLKQVKISPIKKNSGTIINGKLEYAELNGFKWLKFIFDKRIIVEGLEFVKPEIDINKIADVNKGKNETNIQSFFGDILSRVDLVKFQLRNGSIQLREKDSILKGNVHGINISAYEIETDSVQLTHLIPFNLGNLEVKMDSATFNLNSYTKATLGAFDYSIAKEILSISNLSLEYDKGWVAVSKERGFQDDIIEFKLKAFKILKMNYSSDFWTSLDIDAHKIEIDSLILGINRNKNLKRPPDKEKPLFKGMLDNVSYNINLDSIIIKNSTIQYGELSVNKHHTGVIRINNINGAITKLTTFANRKKEFEHFEGSFSGRLNDAAKMQIDLKVPYENNNFSFRTRLRSLKMSALNKSLIPLLGVEFKDGFLEELDYQMQASYYQSINSFKMDYSDLHLTVLNEEENGSEHKNSLMTSIANVAIRHHNLPEDHGYMTANYTTNRNIYRSPFQFIVAGVLDGTMHILPRKSIQSIINKDDKKKRRRKKE